MCPSLNVWRSCLARLNRGRGTGGVPWISVRSDARAGQLVADAGRITPDGGVMLLAGAERRQGIADRIARLISNARNPLFVTHSVPDILRARMLAIGCG